MPNRKLISHYSVFLAVLIITTLAILLPSRTSDAEPFLIHKPYDGFKSLNSYYDHDLPNYSTANSSVTDFTGNEKGDTVGVACGFGYNCYDGHAGTDYNTASGDIKAAARGEVHMTLDANNPYGKSVFLKHDLDGDGLYDYITQYSHLDSIEADIDDDVEVSAGQKLGVSGNTGTGSQGNHLHFGVRKLITSSATIGSAYSHPTTDPYGWWSNDADPAAGREGVGGSYTSTESDWLWGDGEPDYEIDDQSVSFQHLVNHGRNFLWREEFDAGMQGGRALRTFGSCNVTNENTCSDFQEWDNWAFWVANIGRSGDYDVEVYVPNYDTGTDVTTEARYRIFHQTNTNSDTYSDQTINQSANQGSWVSLGTYYFNSGAKAAVRLVDEVRTVANHSKVIWADAVRWEEVAGGNSAGCTDFPDVDEGDWYYPHVRKLSCEGIVHGYPDGYYRPGNDVNRVELIKMAVEASGKHCCLDCAWCDNCTSCLVGFPAPYVDINPFAWYMPYLNAAYWGGWIPGEGLTFEPEGVAKRSWVAKVLVNANGGYPGACVDDGTSPFLDIGPSSKCHQDYIYAWQSHEMGIFDGNPANCSGGTSSGEYFCGHNVLNRAEAAKVIECAFLKDTSQK